MYLLTVNDSVNSRNTGTQEFDNRLDVLNEIARLFGKDVVENLLSAIIEGEKIGIDVTNYGEVEFQLGIVKVVKA